MSGFRIEKSPSSRLTWGLYTPVLLSHWMGAAWQVGVGGGHRGGDAAAEADPEGTAGVLVLT